MNFKENLLEQAKSYLNGVVREIESSKEGLDLLIARKEAGKKSIADRDRHIEHEVLEYNKKRAQELSVLVGSPYFFKCEICFDDADDKEVVCIGKYNFSERQIYSWLSPIAKLRFADVGDFSYTRPNGAVKSGMLFHKDQFMIADGKIIYMASESEGAPRQLIYQEHLSNRKAGFILPEVIAKMEKRQDEVIRADYRGSYLISGPAGSGKTTLALHRVAYLTQSPDTAEMFPGNNIILFVQDEKTLEYFRAIFPQLGITDVVITTFQQWVLQMLNLSDFSYVYHYGANEAERDEYEYLKQAALQKYASRNDAVSVDRLALVYQEYFDEKYAAVHAQQIREKKLDRFDLIILLQSFYHASDGLKKETLCVVKKKNGEMKTELRQLPLQYSLMIIDEAQNYLAAEIAILKTCINANGAILYTGDLAQKTKLGTIEDWQQVGETFADGRKIVLDKVYRSTKEILRYIQARGYDVDIPDELRDGVAVMEKRFHSKLDELDYVRDVVKKNKDITIGILNNSSHYLEEFRHAFHDRANVHVLSTLEAQGVEFEILILVGHEVDKACEYRDEKLRVEKQRVERDLNYVAMTRAMNELYVCLVE